MQMHEMVYAEFSCIMSVPLAIYTHNGASVTENTSLSDHPPRFDHISPSNHSFQGGKSSREISKPPLHQTERGSYSRKLAKSHGKAKTHRSPVTSPKTHRQDHKSLRRPKRFTQCQLALRLVWLAAPRALSAHSHQRSGAKHYPGP